MPYSNNTGLPSVTDVLAPYINKDFFTDEHRLRGETVHEAIAAYLNDYWHPSLPSEWQGYLDSAKRWLYKNIATALSIEQRFVNDAGLEYCGQIDLFMIDNDDKLVLVDWKTSIAEQPWWRLQLVGYYMLLTRNNFDIKLMAVRLQKNGSMPLVSTYRWSAAYENIFISALNIYKFFNPKPKK